MTTQSPPTTEARPPGRPEMKVHESTTLLRTFMQVSEAYQQYVGNELTVNQTDLQAMQHLIQSGPLSPSEIARRLDISTAAATIVVDRLVKVGHVTRTPNPADRRGIVVVPEAASVAKAMSTLMPMIMGIDRVINEFDEDEQETISRYLRRVVDVYATSIPSEDEA